MDWLLYALTAAAALLLGYILGQRVDQLAPIARIIQTRIKQSQSQQQQQQHKSTVITTHAHADASSSTLPIPPTVRDTSAHSSPHALHQSPADETQPDDAKQSNATADAASNSDEAESLDDDADEVADDVESAPASATLGATSGSASLALRTQTLSGRRVVIVAKQLPLRTVKQPDGSWSVTWDDSRNFLSGCGLLRRFMDVKWVGSPNSDVEVTKEEQDDYESLLYEYDCIPVFLPKGLSERFFNGFCKSILWPMLHYVMPASESTFGQMWDDQWQSYTAANTLYASVVSHCVESSTDMIWIQNYHLLLLPSFLRTKLPRAKIGIFIHTPFTSSDVFRVLPTRHNILSSIMASDLIGFHTFDYARHFLSCIKRVMDLDFETMPGGMLGVKYNGRFVSIVISHVGIDSASFKSLTTQPTVIERVQQLKLQHAGRQIVCGVDDLDVVKCPLLKLQAIHYFLTNHPEWREKVAFVCLLIPSSGKSESITVMQAEAHRIQVEFGQETIQLIDSTHQQISMTELVALYNASDLAMVTSVADGLNLVPFEFTASQNDTTPGALIISELIGCARTISGSLRCNPFDLHQVSECILTALQMSLPERLANHARRKNYVLAHTVERWASGFLEQLDRATRQATDMNYVQVGWGSNVKLMGVRSDFAHLDEDALTVQYRKANKRILLLDYDGTLTPADKNQHKSSLVGPSPAIKKLLRLLTEDEDNVVFIVSGRVKSTLSLWFADLPELGLAAEKGLFLKWPQRLASQCRMDLNETPDEGIFAAALGKAADSINANKASPKLGPMTTSASNNSVSSSVTGSDAHLLRESANETSLQAGEWECLVPLEDLSWKEVAISLMKSYCESTDGSWIEDKDCAVVWHYEDADPEYGRMQSSELSKYLFKVLANPSVDIVKYDYNRILEVKPHGVSKGMAATAILESLLNKHITSFKQAHPQPAQLNRSTSHSKLSHSQGGGSSPLSIVARASTQHQAAPHSPLSTSACMHPDTQVLMADCDENNCHLTRQLDQLVPGDFVLGLGNIRRRVISVAPVRRGTPFDEVADGLSMYLVQPKRATFEATWVTGNHLLCLRSQWKASVTMKHDKPYLEVAIYCDDWWCGLNWTGFGSHLTRKAGAARNCGCVRRQSIRMPSVEYAHALKQLILDEDEHVRIIRHSTPAHGDRFMRVCFNSDRFECSVDQLRNACVGNDVFQQTALYKAAIEPLPAADDAAAAATAAATGAAAVAALLITPRIMGLWLGDGAHNDAVIFSTDDETLHELEEYAASIDMTTNWSWSNEWLEEDAVVPPGVFNVVLNCRKIRIAPGPQDPPGVNRFRRALNDLGLLWNKHIPTVYMQGSEDDKLQLASGVFDSDGHYDRLARRYKVEQGGQPHKRFFDDFRTVCLSFAGSINVSSVQHRMRPHRFASLGVTFRDGAELHDSWTFTLTGAGITRIPCRLPHKIATLANVINTTPASRCKFTITPLRELPLIMPQLSETSEFVPTSSGGDSASVATITSAETNSVAEHELSDLESDSNDIHADEDQLRIDLAAMAVDDEKQAEQQPNPQHLQVPNAGALQIPPPVHPQQSWLDWLVIHSPRNNNGDIDMAALESELHAPDSIQAIELEPRNTYVRVEIEGGLMMLPSGQVVHNCSPPKTSPIMSAFAADEPFFLCCGDDRSDEDMFLAVQNKDYLLGRLRGLRDPLEPLQFKRLPSQTHHHPHRGNASPSLSPQKQRHGRLLSSDGSESSSPVQPHQHQHHHHHTSSISKPSKGKKPAAANVFTICVGMKPSAAHYYLHDDEEVIKMLVALATCTQRMAATRQADNQRISQINRNMSINTMSHILMQSSNSNSRQQSISGTGVDMQAKRLSPYSRDNATNQEAQHQSFSVSSAQQQQQRKSHPGSSFLSQSIASAQRKSVTYASEDDYADDSEAEIDYASGSDSERG